MMISQEYYKSLTFILCYSGLLSLVLWRELRRTLTVLGLYKIFVVCSL